MKWGVLYTFDANGNILTQLPEVIGHARKATTPFETPTADQMPDKTVRPTNQYIIIHPNFSRERDAKLMGKIEIKDFIGLLCLAAAMGSN